VSEEPQYQVRYYVFSDGEAIKTMQAELNAMDRKNYRPDHYIFYESGHYPAEIIIYRKYQKDRATKSIDPWKSKVEEDVVPSP